MGTEKRGKSRRSNQIGLHYRPHEKTIRWQTSIGRIEIEEQCFLHRKKRGIVKRVIDPFFEKTGITNRAYSKQCQKLITDFRVEESFQMAVERMKERHGMGLTQVRLGM